MLLARAIMGEKKHRKPVFFVKNNKKNREFV